MNEIVISLLVLILVNSMFGTIPTLILIAALVVIKTIGKFGDAMGAELGRFLDYIGAPLPDAAPQPGIIRRAIDRLTRWSRDEP